jgi:hypothetical protein
MTTITKKFNDIINNTNTVKIILKSGLYVVGKFVSEEEGVILLEDNNTKRGTWVSLDEIAGVVEI